VRRVERVAWALVALSVAVVVGQPLPCCHLAIDSAQRAKQVAGCVRKSFEPPSCRAIAGDASMCRSSANGAPAGMNCPAQVATEAVLAIMSVEAGNFRSRRWIQTW